MLRLDVVALEPVQELVMMVLAQILVRIAQEVVMAIVQVHVVLYVQKDV
jgi:hypothetical protein